MDNKDHLDALFSFYMQPLHACPIGSNKQQKKVPDFVSFAFWLFELAAAQKR